MGEVGGGEAPPELPLNTEGEGGRQTHTHKTKLNKNKLGQQALGLYWPWDQPLDLLATGKDPWGWDPQGRVESGLWALDPAPIPSQRGLGQERWLYPGTGIGGAERRQWSTF